MRCHAPVILALRRLRQEDFGEFKGQPELHVETPDQQQQKRDTGLKSRLKKVRKLSSNW